MLDLPVADVLERWPAAMRLFLDHGMACLGCPFNTFDSLGEALAIHHISTAAFVDGLQKVSDLGGYALPQGEQR